VFISSWPSPAQSVQDSLSSYLFRSATFPPLSHTCPAASRGRFHAANWRGLVFVNRFTWWRRGWGRLYKQAALEAYLRVIDEGKRVSGISDDEDSLRQIVSVQFALLATSLRTEVRRQKTLQQCPKWYSHLPCLFVRFLFLHDVSKWEGEHVGTSVCSGRSK
jgi:hypothetical protein